jgi:hypothetical protein
MCLVPHKKAQPGSKKWCRILYSTSAYTLGEKLSNAQLKALDEAVTVEKSPTKTGMKVDVSANVSTAASTTETIWSDSTSTTNYHPTPQTIQPPIEEGRHKLLSCSTLTLSHTLCPFAYDVKGGVCTRSSPTGFKTKAARMQALEKLKSKVGCV